MLAIKSLHLLVFWYLVTIIKLIRTECADNILEKDGVTYVFSTTQSNFEEAERKCSARGGEIVQISDDNDRKFFWPSLLKFYLQDTSEVEIWRGAGFPCKIKYGNTCWIAYYKFRQASGTNNDASPLIFSEENMKKSFTQTFNQWDLSSIRLFRRQIGNFTQLVKFCWTREADKVASVCSGDYKQNFKLFGGNRHTENSIMLYNVKVRNYNVTSRLNFSHVGEEIFDSPSRIYLPDISVFIGARSEIDQSNWFWNNRTIVTDRKFPVSSISKCQEMTWPLTYKYLHENGINLRTKECGRRGLAYFICKIKYEIKSAVAGNDGNGGCNIMWNHNFVNQHVSYKLTISNKSSVLDNVYFNQSNTGSSVQDATYFVNISSFTEKMNIFFKIQAFSSCGFNSSIVSVSGFCISNAQETSQPPSIAAIVISLVVILLVLSSIFGYFAYKNYHIGSRTKSASMAVTSTLARNEPVEFNDLNQSNDVIRTEELPTPNTAAPNPPITDTCKARSHTESSSNVKAVSQQTNNSPNSLLKLEERYIHECSVRFKNFHKEFEEIQRISAKNSKEHTSGSSNAAYNRYKNILPYDHAIVSLPGHRYINASFIEGFPSNKRFIATQGPIKKTVDDFWEMIWTHDASIIVMLCKCIENGKKKCEKYWPGEESKVKSNNLNISLKSQKNFLDITIRTLKVYHISTQEVRVVTQFHYTGWPDHGIPITTTSMAKLRKLVNAVYEANDEGPIVVHCSAGAGRTGAFIAYDAISEEVEKSGEVEMMKIVLKMRENRMKMVQTPEQYIFVYKLAVEDYLLRNTEMSRVELAELMEDIVRLQDRSSIEWNLLSNQCISTPVPRSNDSNYINTVELDNLSSHQVVIFVGEKRLMMDAHIVEVPAFPQPLIVSASPAFLEPEKKELFWRMVEIKKVSHIINLDESCLFDDALARDDQSLTFGNFTINITNSQGKSQKSFLLLTIQSSDFKESIQVTHQRLSLSNEQSLQDSSTVKIIWKEIEASMNKHPKSRTLLYSSDPSNHIGMFLALGSLMDQFVSEDKFDVFRTFKDLRAFRPTFLNNQNLYQDCYKFMHRYVQETTSNSKIIYENL